MNPGSRSPVESLRIGDRRFKRPFVIGITCVGIIAAALAFGFPADNVNRDLIEPGITDITRLNLALPNISETELFSAGNGLGNKSYEDDWHIAIVESGDNLSAIFSRLGLETEDLYTLLSSSDEARELERVRPGQILKFRLDSEGGLLELIHETDDTHGTRVIRESNHFKVSQYTLEVEKRTSFAAGILTKSLYQSALATGLSDKIIMELAEIFGWDIDFALDIRSGDRFVVIYEETFFSGEKLGDGHILAAEFINNHKIYRAIRYLHPNGQAHYYTPEGKSMRQAFLRSPVDFRRISSHFQPSRWHPILGTKRPHMGVDYAAAQGTPVKAAGAGHVASIGKKSGYGNTIILRHQDPRYTTLYAHMSRFKKGLRRGDRVEQGEIIGYVGQTGLATGPHLHYEFQVDGAHQNPVTVKLPGPPPIDLRYRDDFLHKAGILAAQLDLHKRVLVAVNSN